MFMEYIVCILIGYFLCCINPSYFIGKIRGVNVKKSGSGNAGASNALILFGKSIGVLCALFDIFKAFAAVKICEAIFPHVDYIFAVTAVAAIFGHIFPFYLKFRGGKGLACLGGVILAFDWRYFLMILAIEIVFVLIVNYICFVPMTASIVFPVSYAIIRHDVIGALILLIPAIVIMIKHTENIKRIFSGTEVRISYLWNKNKEVERVTGNQKSNKK